LVRKILLRSVIGLGRGYVAIGVVCELIWLPFDVSHGPGVASHESKSGKYVSEWRMKGLTKSRAEVGSGLSVAGNVSDRPLWLPVISTSR